MMLTRVSLNLAELKVNTGAPGCLSGAFPCQAEPALPLLRQFLAFGRFTCGLTQGTEHPAGAGRRRPGRAPPSDPEGAGHGAADKMVATRQAARRQGQAPPAVGDTGSTPGPQPAGAVERTYTEIGTSVSTKMPRRSRAICKPEVIKESQLEQVERTEAKSDASDSLEIKSTRNENTSVHSAQSAAEPQVDGDVSEAESNCSAVSGLQTPLIIRVTRRRQIVVPYQPDSPAKKRHDKTTFLNELSSTLDEDDVSEAESCSGVVSGVRMPNATRTTRKRQSKKKLQPDPVCEAQSEDISDAESCCFHMEQPITTKRLTRSMRMKAQVENNEEVNRIVSEDENLIEDTVKSEPLIISDSRPAPQLVSDKKDASSVTEHNEESSLSTSKCSSKSANATLNEDVKQDFLNDTTPSSLTKMKQSSNTESPRKKAIKDTQILGVDDSEEESDKIQEEHSKILVRGVKLKNMDLCLTDCMSPKQLLESEGQLTPNVSKKVPEYRRIDAEAAVERSLACASELKKDEQSSAVSSPREDAPVAQITGSVAGRCRMLEISVDSGEDQTVEYADSVSHSSERSSSGNNSLTLFLSKDESDESENSDVADIDTVEENKSYMEADERTPSMSKPLKKNSLHVEGLFVIDTEPGMGSNQKYYLDQVDQASVVESKHEGNEKVEESSDLEEAEEELIDEDEKDEDDDLLKNKIDVLHLSSSIDPGLNIKKLGGLYISFDGKKQKPSSSVIKQPMEKKKDQLLQKSIITPDFEKKECVPPFRESLHQLKKQRRAEREKTTGDGWFGMKAPEITSELKNDLKVLKMRASLDPKHFYKKNDRDGLPKYFQVGTVVDSPIDFYHSRIPKKQRKKTIVEELLADSEFRRYNKRKYQEIMSEKAAFAAGKKNRKKKKFHN
ncbi:deoxynucleotidyltransferase terminal-interacting protein 2 [Cygnus atratus]|uniref:deoxynucleotidyltransferase terminal-interacting protein 2 n=1 Tax=Cygnus atratus TaxID=8868 RepID=UPI0021B6FD0A|nr:deoxynucleotidyltransferase terminal-interacting protein 2 [Cygnus atratus]